jgi:hypothetical protein
MRILLKQLGVTKDGEEPPRRPLPVQLIPRESTAGRE